MLEVANKKLRCEKDINETYERADDMEDSIQATKLWRDLANAGHVKSI